MVASYAYGNMRYSFLSARTFLRRSGEIKQLRRAARGRAFAACSSAVLAL